MWRNAGLTYLRYSQVAAEVTKKCAKVRIPQALISYRKIQNKFC